MGFIFLGLYDVTPYETSLDLNSVLIGFLDGLNHIQLIPLSYPLMNTTIGWDPIAIITIDHLCEHLLDGI
jgi:hypothetical protein